MYTLKKKKKPPYFAKDIFEKSFIPQVESNRLQRPKLKPTRRQR